MTGYLARDYAESLAEWGAVRELPRCGGWLLEREIPGGAHRDAMGPYPVFACRDWSALAADLSDLEGKLVAVSLVADPFGDHDAASLRRCFPDVAIPFKEHFVIDLQQPVEQVASSHHRRATRRARRQIVVETSDAPLKWLDDWVGLYDTLVERHGITGMRAFSRRTFAAQLAVAGVVAVRALHDGLTVAMHLWMCHGDVAYSHLGASSEVGYELAATFAVYWASIEHFAARGLAWMDLGGGAGVNGDAEDGLTRFKRGWATGVRPAWFCGRILNRPRYASLAAERGGPPTAYFPAYRAGEFG